MMQNWGRLVPGVDLVEGVNDISACVCGWTSAGYRCGCMADSACIYEL